MIDIHTYVRSAKCLLEKANTHTYVLVREQPPTIHHQREYMMQARVCI